MDLAGRRIAVAGDFACFSREAALSLLKSMGGVVCRRVTPSTDLVVVGQAFPLTRNGVNSSRFEGRGPRYCRSSSIETIRELELLRLLFMDDEASVAPITFAHLVEASGLNVAQLRKLTDSGILAVRRIRHEIAQFDFVAVCRSRQIGTLISSGHRFSQILKSLKRERDRTPEEFDRLISFRSFVGDDIRVLDDNGRLRSLSGQFFFDFEMMTQPAQFAKELPAKTFDQLFSIAWDAEQGNNYKVAVKVYQQLLFEHGPNVVVCFNLANCLYALKKYNAACERYRQALELDPSKLLVWNNLGNALMHDPDCIEDAIDAFHQACGPYGRENHEALFNLGRAYDALGDAEKAKKWFRLYLESTSDQGGHFAVVARNRIFDQRSTPTSPALFAE